jgi:sRNA-binding protein
LNCPPLKVGICEEVIAQHPELSRHRIKRLLKEYTRHELYWSTLKAGTPRIELDGNAAGEVTLEDEQHALIQMARMARRAAAREAEARKAAAALRASAAFDGRYRCMSSKRLSTRLYAIAWRAMRPSPSLRIASR